MNSRISLPVIVMLLAGPSAYALAGQQPPPQQQPQQTQPQQTQLPQQPSPQPGQPVQPAQPTQPGQPSPAPQQPTPNSTPQTAGPNALAPVGPTPADPAAAAISSFYRLQPTDVVDVKYTYTPEYNATVMVRPDGFITLPIVGEVLVARLTVREVKDVLVTQASKRLRDPELTVEIKDFQKPRFVVGGDVGKPGQFELRGQVTVLEAVAMAGGFKTSAKHSQVLLFRRFDQEKAVTRIVDAKALTRPGSDQEDPLLLPGDFLFVPQNRISKIERFIPIQTIGWLLNMVI